MELPEIEVRIDELKAEIDALRPIDADTENRIMQKFRLDWNYHSNNLEGNSLTFGETKTFLLHGITAEGKPLKDHLDLKGHNEAILLLDEVIKNNRPLNETFIRELHQIILHEPYDRPAVTPDGQPTSKRIQVGQYKTSPNHVKTATGEIFYFASPEETPAKMNDLMNWYAKAVEEGTMHPLEIAALYHYRFIRIHPFDDGNGRMARILMNLILMKYAYPPVIIKTQEKTDYFRALQKADGGDEISFISYVGEQLLRSLDIYLKGAKGENIEDQDDVDKELALLKLRLKEKTGGIVYSRETAKSIIDKSVEPVLVAFLSKFTAFDDLFSSRKIQVSFRGGNENEIHESMFDASTIVAGIKKFILRKHLNGLRVQYSLLDLKSSDTAFNVDVTFDILFNRYSYDVSVSYHQDFYMKINYSNEPDKEKFLKSMNDIAKRVLKDIEDRALN